jgi:hypothetical protein
MTEQTFHESLYYELVITTPLNVEQADVERQLASGKWKFEIELDFDVSGKFVEIEHPIDISDGPQERTFKCVVLLTLELRPREPIDPEHYSRRDTLDFFSASVDLPDTWEIIEWGRHY